MLTSTSDLDPINDVLAWLDNFADTYINTNKALREGFLDSKLFGSPIVAIYLREIVRDDFDADPVGWIQFEATVRGGKIFKTNRVIRPH